MSRRRPTWPELPEALRDLIESELGVVVVDARSHDGGYSPGLASTLVTDDGGRTFVKAVAASDNEVAATLYRREAEVAAVLPEDVPAPRLRWSAEHDDWVLVAFDAVDGRTPAVPWQAGELDAVLDLASRLAEVPAPDVPQIPVMADAEDGAFTNWRQLADRRPAGLATYEEWVVKNVDRLADVESGWREAVAGDVLVHGDFRGDNVIVPTDGRGAVVVDWPYASRGAAFCDVVGMLPALATEGGPQPEEIVRTHPVARAADPDAVTAYVAAIVGYFTRASLDPPPQGIPHVRAFQRAQAEVGVVWLRERLRS
ncbi:aminoglycoside phosphotransferase [Beutenbergia cavernae DSM 12333]|uniref:Aminoglycoside phosphotransferase n=1 Tax=Beutenbergia cavernae (strain ATCC BAA-8 / DSM 12333 / CCUG 43141 / JCM 11478 / NBRC 16432 / NCIMB 13614 / HKI 0122) TaxID=471853 RepID=C5C2D0_BEUC1|nr:aminoglycoside phosphotransferase family protein [Beutenbergia cavernae]ACQ79616.1 aminoglycoside phosphotransferase [Beutenbergia cavernae DSM 12333]